MTTEAGSGHPTSCLSCADLVAALFFREMRWDPQDPTARNVDSFVLSKGHAAPILWAALHEAGALTEDPLSLRRIDSMLEGHPTPRNPWVKVATGSLGQGSRRPIASIRSMPGSTACSVMASARKARWLSSTSMGSARVSRRLITTTPACSHGASRHLAGAPSRSMDIT
ncbi:MAG: hypothetical protein ACRD2X_03310 [Vicinamibacteraceae bacterium]